MHGLAKRQAPEASSCYASEAARAGSGASRKLIAVAKVRITEAGRDALEDSGKASVKSREGLTTIKSWCSLLLDARWFGIPSIPRHTPNQRAPHRGT